MPEEGTYQSTPANDEELVPQPVRSWLNTPLMATVVSMGFHFSQVISRGYGFFAKVNRLAVVVLLSGSVAVGIIAYTKHEPANAPTVIASVVAGEVVCPVGEQVVGIFLRAYGFKGSFIPFTLVAGKPNIATFSEGFQQNAAGFTISVGCGGTKENWAHNDVALPANISIGPVRIECTDEPNLPGKNGTLNGSCTVALLVQPSRTPAAVAP